MQQFLILGGDSRQRYLHQTLTRQGLSATLCYEQSDIFPSLEEMIRTHSVILCPIPFTKDGKHLFSVVEGNRLNIDCLFHGLTPDHHLFGGNIPDFITEYASLNRISCYDYMKMESLALANTVATAEGAILEAIQMSPRCLHCSKCLVTGFGRCGKTLAMKLKGLDAHVAISDQNPDLTALAGTLGLNTVDLKTVSSKVQDYDFIFNTIPSPVINREFIQSLNPDVTIIDIATAPGGVDFEGCTELGIQAKLCPGLPGKYSPKAAAELMYQEIVKIISIKEFL